MATIKLVVEYLGTNYHGFQRQDNVNTIQSELESALSKVFKQQITIVASGRTDTGVHAKGQVCSFQVESATFDVYKSVQSINSFLPSDIAVKDLRVVSDDFHARYSAKSKTYIYKCYVSQFRSPLRDATHLQLYKAPNIEQARKDAAKLVGTHNFSDYCLSRSKKENNVRTITELKVTECDDEIHFEISADGFLHGMVRIIVGKLLGLGKTAPANGLCLDKVEY